MILPVVKFGNSVLREKAAEVKEITPEIRQLVADMLETMYNAQGVGLAAEQVGRTERLCVIDVPKGADKKKENDEFNAAVSMPLVLINPEIKSKTGSQRDSEGCLSFPEIFAQVTRANEVAVEYTDLDGARKSATARGLLARAIQHECDHLDGALFVDKLSAVQLITCKNKLKKLAAENKA